MLTGNIRYVESGFMGHRSDAQTIGIMRRMGTGLCFPEQCVLLGETLMVIANYDALNCSAVSSKIGQNEKKM